MKLLLVGTGYMAKEYAKVLQALSVDFDVIGRGKDNCDRFCLEFPDIKVFSGGLEKFHLHDQYDAAIVASNVESLFDNTIFLIEKGINNILLEKPGGKNKEQIIELARIADVQKATVLLGYNRRFYSSVLRAKEIIKEDGGVLSFNFEFTEWVHTVEPLGIDKDVKQNWFLANSTHVVDTAFYLGGKPREIVTYVAGGIKWHTASSIFAGAGISDRDALFSYNANWEAPGRWVLEVLTKKRRCIFKPMEKLQVQEIGSVAVNPVEIDDTLDVQFKPGLYLQTKAFLNNELEVFCDIQEQENMMTNFYLKMSGYGS